MTRTKPSPLFAFLDKAEKWTGGKALAVREPGCPECGTPLIAASIHQPALFIHGGYGATKKITWAICPEKECRWSLEHVVEEVRPDKGGRFLMPKPETETVIGCDIPGHPNDYVHEHHGGWHDCPKCLDDLHHAAISRAADDDAPPLEEAMTRWHDLHTQGRD